MPNIRDAVQRLNRWGTEDSAAVEKLKAAAGEVAGLLAPLLTPGVLLPRGYKVELTTMGRALWTVYCRNVSDTRTDALSFAEDIADGWLQELADWHRERYRDRTAAQAELDALAAIVRKPER